MVALICCRENIHKRNNTQACKLRYLHIFIFNHVMSQRLKLFYAHYLCLLCIINSIVPFISAILAMYVCIKKIACNGKSVLLILCVKTFPIYLWYCYFKAYCLNSKTSTFEQSFILFCH